MAKPSDFFINVLDFFAVLLPGAILTGVLWEEIGPVVTTRLEPFGSGALVASFAVLSYVLGQLAYAAGSRLDGPYDRYRKHGKAKDAYLQRAGEAAKSEGIPPGVSTYQWVEADLRLHHPAAAAEIDRAQAESKFFRTLTAVAVVAAAAGFLANDGAQLAVSLLLLPISITRFFELRLKATQLAYRYYVIARAASPSAQAIDQRAGIG